MAFRIKERVLGGGHPSIATIYNNMAGVYQAKKNYNTALDYYERALKIRRQANHPDVATVYNNMAGVYEAQGQRDKALEYYSKALAICEQDLGEEHPKTKVVRNNLKLVKILGRLEQE